MLDFVDLEKITAMSNVLHFYVTEVKNKIAYQSTNKVKKLKYFRKVINIRQPVKVSWLCNIQYLSYLANVSVKITENSMPGDATLVSV